MDPDMGIAIGLWAANNSGDSETDNGLSGGAVREATDCPARVGHRIPGTEDPQVGRAVVLMGPLARPLSDLVNTCPRRSSTRLVGCLGCWFPGAVVAHGLCARSFSHGGVPPCWRVASVAT
jgi:hypothetical protein